MLAVLALASALSIERAAFTSEHLADVEARIRANSGTTCASKLSTLAGGDSVRYSDLAQDVKASCVAEYPEKEQCPGVTRLTSAAIDMPNISAREVAPAADVCKGMESFLLRIARDIHAIDAEYPGSPACVTKVASITGLEIS